MRIISGTFKGRTIPVPRNFKGRPTTDFARESLFNVLQHMVDYDGLHALDLFSGTGAFSLECHSRGAESVMAVELAAPHVQGISANFKLFEVKNGQVLKADVFSFLAKNTRAFHLVFADAPFDHPKLKDLPDMVLGGSTLHKDGLLIIEHPAEIDFSTHPNFEKHKSYGHVNFSFFRHLGS
jgi:16S rRNA (guanine(966)-N(2))-methyltransferase RsmD